MIIKYIRKLNNNKKTYYLLWIISVFIIIVLIINFYVVSFSNNLIYSNVGNIKKIKVWLVLWASVKWDKTPSDILKNRLLVALDAYNKWTILKIILSWDNSLYYYNEPVAMQKFLLTLWVKKEDLYLDYAGFDTYDSIYRARDIFGIKKMVIFTQEDHLKRAIYISKKMGIDSYWISAGISKYKLSNYFGFREFLARIKAFLEVEIFNPKPKFLWNKIKILFETPGELKLRNIKYLIDLKWDNSIQKFVNNKISFNDVKYIPKDLVELKWKFTLDLKWYWQMRKEAKIALDNMWKDFYDYFGEKIKVVSSYRSYIYQKWIKDRWCPDNLCAKAWFSEHQTGLALDLWEASNQKEFLSNIKYRKYFEWLNKNAYKYWFSNTYIKWLKVDWYEIEPWHWRYLWIEFSTYLKNNNMTIAEFFKKKY